MKKKYVTPTSEYIRFDIEDVITDDMPLGGIDSYNGTGDRPNTSAGIGEVPPEAGED